MQSFRHPITTKRYPSTYLPCSTYAQNFTSRVFDSERGGGGDRVGLMTCISDQLLSCYSISLFSLLVVEIEVGRVKTFGGVVEFKRLCASNAMQCFVVVCCSALHCVAVRCSTLQCVAMRCSALQYGTVHCSALQCIADVCFQHDLEWQRLVCSLN